MDVVDKAFEYLINQSSKGEKGQFFTPRYVIDMCVKMLNPQEDEYMIDTAAGSSGFPVHTIFHVWRQILADEELEASHLFSLEDKPPRCKEYVEEKVFAIDFDEKAVRVARTLNLIAGDGQTNVLHLNTLDYELWDEVTEQDEWDDYSIFFATMQKMGKDNSGEKVYGPAAVGKLTIGRELVKLNGFRLFHNHLTVDAVMAVFDFGSESFIKLREQIWLSVFKEAAQQAVSLIFTFSPERTVQTSFIQDTLDAVESCGGKIRFIELICPIDELEQRIENPSRAEFNKLRSLESFRQIRQQGNHWYPQLPNSGLTIDTSKISPQEAARKIFEFLSLNREVDIARRY